MKYTTILLLVIIAIVSQGCTILQLGPVEKEIIRENEPLKSVTFEDGDTDKNPSKQFHVALEGYKEKNRVKDVTDYGFIIGFYMHIEMLSDNALKNDAIAECDTNHDAHITKPEARVFYERYVEWIDRDSAFE